MHAQLDNHRWKNRIILIFTQSESLALYQQQVKDLYQDDSELEERDLVIYSIFAQSSKPELPLRKIQSLQQSYNASKEPFLCVLIGKDGYVKRRMTKLYPRKQIFDLIDSMPMRQSEMRRKKKG